MTKLEVINFLLIIASVTLGWFRVFGYKSQAFQAMAHLLVGGLIGAYAVGHRPIYLGLVVALSVLEVVCFLMGRAMGREAGTASPGLATHKGPSAPRG